MEVDTLTARECLEELRVIRIRLRRLERDIKELEEKICSLKAIDYSQVRITGGTPKDLAEQIAIINDKKEVARKRWLLLAERSEQIERLIDVIDTGDAQKDEQLKAILHERYVNCGSWEQVAEVAGVSREWVRKRLYDDAVEEFEKNFRRVGKSWQKLAYDL